MEIEPQHLDPLAGDVVFSFGHGVPPKDAPARPACGR